MSALLALSVHDVSLSFGRTQVLSDVHLDVGRGERHAIIGPNGAGKSSLFNVITGIYKAKAGRILLDGRVITGLQSYQIARLGLCRSFQISALFGGMSVWENVRVGAMASKRIRAGMARRASSDRVLNRSVGELIALVGLEAVADKPAGDLTYSEQRALEVAMTLAPEPSVILLDEPTAGMSVEESSRFVGLLTTIARGRTLLVVEHDMDVVFSLCNRITVIVSGTVLATGDPAEITTNKRVQDAYLGEGHSGRA